jgi:hypothetical protein
VDRLHERIETDAPVGNPGKGRERVLGELVLFASGNPDMFELMRTLPDIMARR